MSTEKGSDRYKATPPSRRLLIAISGIPGSGKTTLAATVSNRLNSRFHEESPCFASQSISTFIPMDGYHLTRAQLSAMPDASTAHARRGAAFTFDGESFLTLVKKLREPLLPESQTLYAPSFDHAVKDPVQDDIAIPTSARVIIVEGNYLSLSRGPWKDAAELMDELWFVKVDFDVARQRLVGRHVKAGIAKDEEDAYTRVTEIDLVNGKDILDNRMEVHEILVSKEDDSWKPESQSINKRDSLPPNDRLAG
ncbi:MAG: hypothetical protein M1812_006838 [Candelaria pacifica]|nr:MAG: hypothetical protein M1812_006838 [Candelaria pacifica]